MITLASHRPPRGDHRTVRLRENLPRLLEELSTTARQPDPPFGAIEESDCDFFLQLLDLLTEGRLRHVKAFGSATKM